MSTPLTLRYTSSSGTGGGLTDAKRDADRAQIAVVEANDAYLEYLGYKPEFERHFSFLALFSLVQSELAVLPGMAGTIW